MVEVTYLPSENKKKYQKMINKLKLRLNQNVNIVEDYKDSGNTKLLLLKKVVIVFIEVCASFIKQFLLEVIQSKKVTLMGQNTTGALDYSNLRESDICEIPYMLRTPKALSRIIDIGFGVDGISINPSVYQSKT